MTRHARKADGDPAMPGDGGDNSYREVERFEHRTLLNMHLAIAYQVIATPFGGEQMIGISAECSYGFRHRDAIAIRLGQYLWIECASDHIAAKIGAVAQPFLVGETEHFYGKGQALLACMQPFNACQRDHDTKGAVVFACVAH